ncbi:FAD:protein FMN transferase [Sphaerotilus mobilis]|uniref:FAD:protein FMN transferase n=1 Tax=Sphaerotilus mobilis TaxID=47994 RepID=A0A4Q7LT98_9BURK|nr:FAD:protein FMN transferase [Sphaerotilus mobilis]RZS58136.1 thiamine biosynthesis lipoprotein [Sphaerotilus mobilis]
MADRARRRLLGAMWLAPGLWSTPVSAAAAAGGVADTIWRHQPWRHDRRALFGSWAELVVVAPDAVADRALAAAWDHLARFDRHGNAWKPGALQRINAALRSGRRTPLPAGLAPLIEQARLLEAASGGACNIALGAAVGAWGFHADRLTDGAPAPSIQRLRDWQDNPPSTRSLRLQGGQIASVDTRVQLDLGAIGKGHAADLALDTLRAAGVTAALVNLGGNLAAMGEPAGRPWRIGIRHPASEGRLAATLEVDGREAVITSAQSERRRRLPDGRWIGHVLDARTLRPVDSAAGVTVVDTDATRADAMATALLAADPAEPWVALAARLGVAQALRVQADGRIEATAALAARLRPV